MKIDVDVAVTVLSFIWMITFPAFVTVAGGLLSICWWVYNFHKEYKEGHLKLPKWLKRVLRK